MFLHGFLSVGGVCTTFLQQVVVWPGHGQWTLGGPRWKTGFPRGVGKSEMEIDFLAHTLFKSPPGPPRGSFQIHSQTTPYSTLRLPFEHLSSRGFPGPAQWGKCGNQVPPGGWEKVKSKSIFWAPHFLKAPLGLPGALSKYTLKSLLTQLLGSHLSI